MIVEIAARQKKSLVVQEKEVLVVIAMNTLQMNSMKIMIMVMTSKRTMMVLIIVLNIFQLIINFQDENLKCEFCKWTDENRKEGLGFLESYSRY